MSRITYMNALCHTTGFPGETEQDHRVLVNFVKEMKFERAGVFAYSEEEGTPAATMLNQVCVYLRLVFDIPFILHVLLHS